MDLSPFLLDHWLGQANDPHAKIDYDLGSSTGPVWTLRELLALENMDSAELLDTRLFYTTAAGTAELRTAIADAHSVDPEHVLPLVGASEALLILFYSAAEPGANVVLPRPGFPANDALAGSVGLEVRSYNLRAENSFQIDLDELRGLIDRNTSFVLVNTPHNPSGAVIADREMQTLHDFCRQKGVKLVSDEVYHPIYHDKPAQSAARLPHATVVGDFSKALCLSGLRLGWMIEPDEQSRRRFLNMRCYFTVCNTALTERLGALAMRNRKEIHDRAQKIAAANLALLDKFFERHQDVLRWVRPQGGMTAFPWLASGADARPFCKRLIDRGIMTAPGDCFGMPQHLRIGFGASAERFPDGLERLEQFLITRKVAIS